MAIRGQYKFGAYRLDADGHVLFCNDERVPLTPKALDVLITLVAAQGKAVSTDELLRTVWPGTVVEPGSLTSHISLLRKALGDTGTPRLIETLPKRGYRFTGRLRSFERSSMEAATDRLMLVVLPFENLTDGEERYDYFSDGLTEEMITQLARLCPAQLGVIARTSAMHYRATSKTMAGIGQELGVSHALEGSVRRAGNKMRITAQLIRISDESHLWAQSFERGLGDVLALQAEVGRAIAREIQIKLTPNDEQRLGLDNVRYVDSHAHELYLRGRHFWHKRTEEAMRKSIECFEEAIHQDPSYAPAYHGVSDAHTMLACRGVVPAAEAFHKAKTAARQGLQIEPELGESFASLAHVRLHDWDWIGLEEDFRRAIEFSPGYALAHYWYAEYLMAMGRTEEAVARVEHGQRWDPINSVLCASVGMMHYLAHRYDDALAALRRGVELDASHYVLHLRLGLVYQQQGLAKEAIEAMQQAVALSGSGTEALAGLAQVYAAAGDKGAARKIVRELSESKTRYASPYNIARIYASLAEPERAFEWLKRAYEEHNPDLIELLREPTFKTLHANTEFSHLARRIGWVNGGAFRTS
ncbi:MAG TPA: winged helix-turn-helix domain-containing protein [Steroidobacteraceae bacterium]